MVRATWRAVAILRPRAQPRQAAHRTQRQPRDPATLRAQLNDGMGLRRGARAVDTRGYARAAARVGRHVPGATSVTAVTSVTAAAHTAKSTGKVFLTSLNISSAEVIFFTFILFGLIKLEGPDIKVVLIPSLSNAIAIS